MVGVGCQGRCLNCRGTSPPQQFAPRPQRTISAPTQFAQLCNCEILLCEQFSHLHSCAIALGGRVMDARGATSSLLRRLSPSRPWLALGTCAVLECVRRECSHDKHVTYLSDKSFLKRYFLDFRLISTEGALRLPMTYDNHPIHPSVCHKARTGHRLI